MYTFDMSDVLSSVRLYVHREHVGDLTQSARYTANN